ncbi:MAG TPA: hypothetical protein VGK86_11855 [Thermoanaerobaculia bacterium]|jgi:hypothetical protein
MGRLILLVIVLAVGYWLYKNSSGGILGSRSTGGVESSTSAPLDRAREAARKSNERQLEADRMGHEDTSTGVGSQIHENMKPSEVRALLGAPDEIMSSVSETGAPREIWTYRSVGKKVIFQNGFVISIE